MSDFENTCSFLMECLLLRRIDDTLELTTLLLQDNCTLHIWPSTILLLFQCKKIPVHSNSPVESPDTPFWRPRTPPAPSQFPSTSLSMLHEEHLRLLQKFLIRYSRNFLPLLAGSMHKPVASRSTRAITPKLPVSFVAS